MMSRAEPLTEEEIELLRKELIEKDLDYARQLNQKQAKFFRAKYAEIKSYQDFKIAEDLKRLILGLHSEKTEHSGAIVVRIHNPLKDQMEAEDASGG